MSNTWLVRCGDGGSAVPDCVRNGVAALRFTNVGDVRTRNHDAIVNELSGSREGNDYEALANDVLAFTNEIAVGDLVLSSSTKAKTFLVGFVRGEYDYRANLPIASMRHVRAVDWRGSVSWNDAPSELAEYKDHDRAVLSLKDQVVIDHAEKLATNETPIADMLKQLAVPRTTRKPVAEQSGSQVCSSCHLRRPRNQFASSTACVDCS